MAASGRRAVTLLELAVVVAIIGTLAGLLAPVILGMMERSRIATAKGALVELGSLLHRAYNDSGYWPNEGTGWSPLPQYPYQQVAPRQFNLNDTILTSATAPIIPAPFYQPKLCSQQVPGRPCWNAPYLPGNSALSGFLDPWGQPYFFTYMRPSDGYGGGVSEAPNGFVVVWSSGPDQLDQTGCSNGSCSVNYARLAAGQSSVCTCGTAGCGAPCSDDVVLFVGPALQEHPWVNPPNGQ